MQREFIWIIEKELCQRKKKQAVERCICQNPTIPLQQMQKAIFQHDSSYHRAKLFEVSVFYNHSLAFFNFIPVSSDTCFLICSSAPLCPTCLFVCQTETKRALLPLSLKSCETDKNTSEREQKAEKSPLQLTFARGSLPLRSSSSLSSSFLYPEDL